MDGVQDGSIMWRKLPGVAICKAIVEAQRKATAVHKDSKNKYHDYKYASAEAVLAEGRDALTSAGLALIATTWGYRDVPLANGSEFSKAVGEMTVEYLLLHESGEVASFASTTAVIPEKGRPLDKAQATALTYSLGYTLRGLLMIPRVDEDEDADARNDHGKREPDGRQKSEEKRQAAQGPGPLQALQLCKQLAREQSDIPALMEKVFGVKDLHGLKAVSAETFAAGYASLVEMVRLRDEAKALSHKIGDLCKALKLTPEQVRTELAGGKSAADLTLDELKAVYEKLAERVKEQEGDAE